MEHTKMTDRTLMALFDPGHRLSLPGGYWMQKDDDTRWQIGQQIGEGEMFLGFSLEANVHFGVGGSFDSEAKRFADAMNHQPHDPTDAGAK
jgi:hypothetical protein